MPVVLLALFFHSRSTFDVKNGEVSHLMEVARVSVTIPLGLST